MNRKKEKNRIHILMITEYFVDSEQGEVSGGVESRYFYLSKEVARHHQVTIITSWRRGLKRKEEINNCLVLRVGPHHKYTGKGSIISRLRFAHAAYRKAKQCHPHVIDAGNFTCYIPGYYAARSCRAKAIATYHEIWAGKWIKNKGMMTGIPGEIWERMALSLKWDGILAVSQSTKNDLIRFGIEGNIITVSPNGIPLKHIKKLRQKKHNKPTICYAGRLLETKRVNDLINALPAIKQKIPDIQCHIIGDGPERQKLEKLAKNLNVYVKFFGFLPSHDDALKEMSRCHVFCHPSAVEGFGIVLVEALALKVPVVTSDIDCFKEINQPPRTGELFKLGNITDIAQAICSTLQRTKTSTSPYAKSYDWQDITKKYTEQLKGIQQ